LPTAKQKNPEANQLFKLCSKKDYHQVLELGFILQIQGSNFSVNFKRKEKTESGIETFGTLAGSHLHMLESG